MGKPQHEPPAAHDPPGVVVVQLTHDRRSIEAACEAIITTMADQGYGDAAQFAVRLSWEEAISNAVHHGNRDRSDGRIEFAYLVDAAQVYIRVTDQGEGFDPDRIEDPTLDENLECPSGRGLLLMRAYMTRVHIDAPGNTVRMVLERPRGG